MLIAVSPFFYRRKEKGANDKNEDDLAKGDKEYGCVFAGGRMKNILGPTIGVCMGGSMSMEMVKEENENEEPITVRNTGRADEVLKRTLDELAQLGFDQFIYFTTNSEDLEKGRGVTKALRHGTSSFMQKTTEILIEDMGILGVLMILSRLVKSE